MFQIKHQAQGHVVSSYFEKNECRLNTKDFPNVVHVGPVPSNCLTDRQLLHIMEFNMYGTLL